MAGMARAAWTGPTVASATVGAAAAASMMAANDVMTTAKRLGTVDHPFHKSVRIDHIRHLPKWQGRPGLASEHATKVEQVLVLGPQREAGRWTLVGRTLPSSRRSGG